MNFSRVKITTTVPLENADAVREALGKAGAGIVGNYSFCSFVDLGSYYVLPSETNRRVYYYLALDVHQEHQPELDDLYREVL